MEKELHTILGASGGVGRELVDELITKEKSIRKVGRTSKGIGEDFFKADLLFIEECSRAVEGSSYVYFCVGLPYDLKVWEKDWPIIMNNVTQSCINHGAKLIFLDNIYMYGPPPLEVPFDEKHPQNPVSKKGLVRKKIIDMMSNSMEKEGLNGVVARAPDFYGPYSNNSMLYETVVKRMLEGKAPQSLFPPDVKHTYSFTNDIARAMILVAEDQDTKGEVYHTPVGDPISFNEIVNILNTILDTQHKLSVMPGFLFKTLSWFIPILREVHEMGYQFKSEYIMSDEKFMKKYPDFKITSNEEGLRKMVEGFSS